MVDVLRALQSALKRGHAMLFTLEALQANDGDCLLLHYQQTGARSRCAC